MKFKIRISTVLFYGCVLQINSTILSVSSLCKGLEPFTFRVSSLDIECSINTETRLQA